MQPEWTEKSAFQPVFVPDGPKLALQVCPSRSHAVCIAGLAMAPWCSIVQAFQGDHLYFVHSHPIFHACSDH